MAASMMAQAGTAASSGQAKPKWEVPSGWKEVPGGQFLVAKFLVTGAGDAQAARQRQQVARRRRRSVGQCQPLARPARPRARWPKRTWPSRCSRWTCRAAKRRWRISPARTPGTGQKARLLAVVVPRAGETWFYKLMGNAQVVQQEKEAFMKFVQTVKY